MRLFAPKLVLKPMRSESGYSRRLITVQSCLLCESGGAGQANAHGVSFRVDLDAVEGPGIESEPQAARRDIDTLPECIEGLDSYPVTVSRAPENLLLKSAALPAV